MNINTMLGQVESTNREVAVNSEEAAELLSLITNNEAQRDIKTDRVDEYLGHIMNGTFIATQIVVGVFKEGRNYIKCILDGHHRLHAIVKANTQDRYKITILEVALNSKEEIRFYYQMFDNKRSSRNLADLLKFKLAFTSNKDRWNNPVQLATALQYSSGYYFTKKGVKSVIPTSSKLSKDEILSDVLDVPFWWESLDWLDSMIDEIKNMTYGTHIMNTLGGVKVFGVMLDSYVRVRPESIETLRDVKNFWYEVIHYISDNKTALDGSPATAIIKGLFDKVSVIKSNEDAKGTKIVPQIFLLFWTTCRKWMVGNRGKSIGISIGSLLRIKNKDVLKECFDNGNALRRIRLP